MACSSAASSSVGDHPVTFTNSVPSLTGSSALAMPQTGLFTTTGPATSYVGGTLVVDLSTGAFEDLPADAEYKTVEVVSA